jgi:hypothetical protein
MTIQLFIGIYTEGTTDDRFIESIIHRSFIELAVEECKPDLDIEVMTVKINRVGRSLTEQILEASRSGIQNYGISVLCVHKDADYKNDQRAVESINTALKELEKQDENYCKIITPVVPVQMIEAWMLSDKLLLKQEIGTTKTDNELGIYRDPETISDPKQAISEAIRVARAELTKRKRKNLEISDLYQPIGQKIELKKLKRLPSYNKFYDSIREAYKTLNFIG